jgi:translation initiation factor IF-1
MNENVLRFRGKAVEAVGNNRFIVQFVIEGRSGVTRQMQMQAYTAGKLRLPRKRVNCLVGDDVQLEVTPGSDIGRITYIFMKRY